MFGGNKVIETQIKALADGLGELKNLVQPVVRVATELEAQHNSLKDSLEDVKHKLDKVSDEFQERISQHETINATAVQKLGDRVANIETSLSEDRGARRTLKAIWLVLGGVITTSIVGGIVFLFTEAYASRERLSLIEKSVSGIESKLDQPKSPRK